MKKMLKKLIEKTPPVPRSLDEITEAHNQLAFQAGIAQYQARFYTKEVERLNTHMESLNWEADARKKLDAAAPKKEEQ